MEEKIKIKNQKGLNLAAIIHKPDTKGKHPAVIILHGFTGYKEEKHIEQLAKNLALKGIIAIRFDASGFGESEGSLEKEYRLSNYLGDVENVYEFIKMHPSVNNSHIGICGHSMGGMAAVIFASNHPEIKAICPISAPYMMNQDKRKDHIFYGWKEKRFLKRTSSRYGKIIIPYSFLEDAQKYNVLDYIKKVHRPLLIVLGDKDVNVDPKDTKLIFENANQPKELFEVEGMDHYYKNFPDLIKKVNGKVIPFFLTNLDL